MNKTTLHLITLVGASHNNMSFSLIVENFFSPQIVNMPKSAAERKRLSRERKRQNMDEDEVVQFKKDEAKRIAKIRREQKTKRTEEEKILHTKRETDRKRDLRRRQKEQKEGASQEIATPDLELSPPAYKTVQSRGKAVTRTKRTLPNDAKKRSIVLQQIVKEHCEQLTPGRRRKFEEGTVGRHSRKRLYFERKPRNDKISKEAEDHIMEFYQQDEISRMLPGKRDDKRVVIDGEVVRKQ